MTVHIDGKKLELDNYQGTKSIEMQIPRGEHLLTVNVINNDSQLRESKVRIVDQATGEAIPIVISLDQAKTFANTPVAGAKPLDVSNWSANDHAVRIKQ